MGGVASPICGNGQTEGAEQCDDGSNGNDLDGCKDDCTYTCEMDGQCSDGNVCNGLEECDQITHRCFVGMGLNCDDADPCTDDRCDPVSGCESEVIDQDADGFSPAQSCGVESPYNGGDCNDNNSDVRPNQTEFFPEPIEPGCAEGSCYDYDCNGVETKSRPNLISCGGNGWTPTVPECGVEGLYGGCGSEPNCFLCTTSLSTQVCH